MIDETRPRYLSVGAQTPQSSFVNRATCVVTALMIVAFLYVPLVSAATKTEEILLGPQAQDAYGKLAKPAITYSPEETIGKILTIIFGFIAILAVSLIMYGGFLWVTSGGEQDKAKKAQGLLVDAAIGLVVLGSVWALSWVLIKTFAEKIIAQ